MKHKSVTGWAVLDQKGDIAEVSIYQPNAGIIRNNIKESSGYFGDIVPVEIATEKPESSSLRKLIADAWSIFAEGELDGLNPTILRVDNSSARKWGKKVLGLIPRAKINHHR